MKKLILTVVFSFLYIGSASADFGLNMGASLQMGAFTADAHEDDSGNTAAPKDNGSASGAVAYGSVFVEGVLADRFMIGVDYVPDALESETTETAKSDMGVAAQTTTTVTNKVQVDFEDLTTIYAGLMLNDNLYVKAGVVTVDVITNEDMGTGASYANAELDGSMFGIGYHNVLDNGVFVRIEGTIMDFDGATVASTGTASTSSITLDSLNGVTGKLSVGKSF